MRVIRLHTRHHSTRGLNLVLTLHPNAVQLRAEKSGEVVGKFGKRFARTEFGSNAAFALFEALCFFPDENLYQLTVKVNDGQ